MSGPVAGAPCVFPFTWKGKVYRDCTTSHNHGVLWCATDIDFHGNYVEDKWGNCDSSCDGCKTEDGDGCIFPFIYNGTEYTECTSVDNNGALWCALNTTMDRRVLRENEHSWGNCEESCIGNKLRVKMIFKLF